MAAIGISQSSSLAPDSSKAKSASASVFAILDRKSKIDPSVDSGMIVENLKGDIELQHVSFRYLTRPNVNIFQDLYLKIHTGKVTHIACCTFVTEHKEHTALLLNFSYLY